jgi:nucleoside-diphosphate-sugar epimerase
MRIAITGAAGWLGRYVTTALEPAHEILLIDSIAPNEATIFDPSSPDGRRRVPLTPTWPYHQVDIRDEAGMKAALEDVEVVVHLAAWPTGAWDLARSTMSTNVMGTFNVFETGRVLGVRRIVSASSINAFGTFFWRISGLPPVRRSLPLVEDEPVVPEDPYSLSKAITELMSATYARAFPIEAVNLRFAGVWSEQKYAETLERGLPPTEAWADDLFQWVHPLDVAQAVSRAALADKVVAVPMTVAAADTRAPEPTMDLLARFRPDLVPYVGEPLPGRASLLSIARARMFLGYAPAHTLDGARR